MAILAANRIELQARAVDKTDAIRKAGALLVESGCVMPEYVDGMLAREELMSTFLGNGVAIPHGQDENRQHIHQTGISVVQLTEGVEWEPDEMVHLVIGIAATSDEHIGVLAALAEAIDDESVTHELAHTTDPSVIMRHLGEPQAEEL